MHFKNKCETEKGFLQPINIYVNTGYYLIIKYKCYTNNIYSRFDFNL